MPIGAITMILANVGLQIYNNWCGSRQNAALQQKREEFERAAKDRNTEHMWRLMREGQELTLQLENEKHADRLKELKDEVDHLLERLTYETTISNWPLKVLPIVMKNQAFGNLLANQEENIAMHVIFTRSNYDKFNKLVYPMVEKQLEQYCDKHWSTMTDHPILFYSGAWKPMVNPTDVQVTAMREELKNLPTLLITPFFRPNDGKLVFQLHMWGVGANSTDKFDVPEIEPTDFQRPFNNQDDYDNEEGLLEEIVEDLVPYLECMIGYMADTYFWSSAGLAPHLPLLLTNGTINTDGMRYLVEEAKNNYKYMLQQVAVSMGKIEAINIYCFNFLNGIRCLINKIEIDYYQENFLCILIASFTGHKEKRILEACKWLQGNDKQHIVHYLNRYQNRIDHIIDYIENKVVATLHYEDMVLLATSLEEMLGKMTLLQNQYTTFYYQAVEKNSVLGCFTDPFGVSKCCIIVILEDLTIDNITYAYFLKKRKLMNINKNAIMRIGVDFNSKNTKSIIENKIKLYQDMIYMESVLSANSYLFSNPQELYSIDVDGIKEWVEKNKKEKDEIILMRVAKEGIYYLTVLLSSEKMQYGKFRTFKLYTLHPNVEVLMGNSSVKKIKYINS